MKLTIETNVVDWLKARKREVLILSAELLGVAVLIGVALFYGAYQPILRDFVVANVAHIKSGDEIPFTKDEVDDFYTRGFRVDPDNLYTYEIESNNIWMAEYTRFIVPYMSYEKATPFAVYPNSIGSVPFGQNQSFHVGGRMLPEDNTVLLNERMFLDERWNDKRNALGTLVHELVHIQRGAYIIGESASLESATSTATMEILAAMCNYGDSLACLTFWDEIEQLSRSSLLVQLNDMGVPGLYDTWARLFWRDQAQQDAYNKAMRFWSEKPGELMELRRKYSLNPWMNVIFGVAYQIPANTGHVICESSPSPIWSYLQTTPMVETCTVLGMPFDDTRYLLQGLMWILR